jgi:hypothetical protein
MFGPSVFESFVYLDTGADKDEALAPYVGTGCWWIEDKPENANLVDSLLLESVLVNHHHNTNSQVNPTVTRVNNWKEIYDLIAG